MVIMNKRLNGQTAIVTGAGRGIGRAIARELAAAGANVVINYATSVHAAQELAKELEGLGSQTLSIQADVSNYAQAGGLVKQVMQVFGRVDILVNNAGITRDKMLKNMSKEQWDEVLHVNLDSLFNCTRQVLPCMLEGKNGKIVNISSFVGLSGNIGQANYAASKAGVIGFTKAVALEVARHGITVNAVCPGFTETDMLQSVPEEIRRHLLEKIPLGRFSQADEVAACVRYIVTEGNYMTGQAISINGGVYI
jgi:acetoacetyl-CoA reductase